jgi:hypothetical protein
VLRDQQKLPTRPEEGVAGDRLNQQRVLRDLLNQQFLPLEQRTRARV